MCRTTRADAPGYVLTPPSGAIDGFSYALSVEDWATESLLAAWEAYQDPATGQRMKWDAKLGESYQAQGLAVVKRRLYQAGIRLATLLNEALGAQ